MMVDTATEVAAAGVVAEDMAVAADTEEAEGIAGEEEGGGRITGPTNFDDYCVALHLHSERRFRFGVVGIDYAIFLKSPAWLCMQNRDTPNKRMVP